MFGYCFRFKSTLALTDKELDAVANSIREISPVCIDLQIEECRQVVPSKEVNITLTAAFADEGVN